MPAVLINGGDWMLNHRLVAPYAPLLAVLLGVSADRALASAPRVPRAVPLAALALLVVGTAFLPREHRWNPSPDAEIAEAEPCWQTLSAAAGPALLPSDAMAPDVLGLISYENPEVYSHDLLGLTDRHIALRGDYYVPQFGKTDVAYTYHEVRPDVVLTQTGPAFFGAMARVSGGTYDETYRTYEFTGLTACRPKVFVVAIREEHVPRILPAFSAFDPKPVEVPR